uniref:Uncharacterized protein LOC105060965 n=1 Tax=Elaeis guineensis var. tenera TaxID=51953 RepID=A0A6I9SH03_ELAGV|nr:uncharacterized protein LOC105060965 [Elaeis guineensis]
MDGKNPQGGAAADSPDPFLRPPSKKEGAPKWASGHRSRSPSAEEGANGGLLSLLTSHRAQWETLCGVEAVAEEKDEEGEEEESGEGDHMPTSPCSKGGISTENPLFDTYHCFPSFFIPLLSSYLSRSR